MSIRVDGNSMSLRSLLGVEKQEKPVAPPANASPPSMFSLGISTGQPFPTSASTPINGLKFSFKSICDTNKQSAPVAVHEHTALRNVFENKKAAQQQQDILRLTSVCDDLTSRLKVVQNRALTAEANLQRTHAVFMQERQSAGNRIKASRLLIERAALGQARFCR